jgi:hypothetical protein
MFMVSGVNYARLFLDKQTGTDPVSNPFMQKPESSDTDSPFTFFNSSSNAGDTFDISYDNYWPDNADYCCPDDDEAIEDDEESASEADEDNAIDEDKPETVIEKIEEADDKIYERQVACNEHMVDISQALYDQNQRLISQLKYQAWVAQSPDEFKRFTDRSRVKEGENQLLLSDMMNAYSRLFSLHVHEGLGF